MIFLFFPDVVLPEDQELQGFLPLQNVHRFVSFKFNLFYLISSNSAIDAPRSWFVTQGLLGIKKLTDVLGDTQEYYPVTYNVFCSLYTESWSWLRNKAPRKMKYWKEKEDLWTLAFIYLAIPMGMGSLCTWELTSSRKTFKNDCFLGG